MKKLLISVLSIFAFVILLNFVSATFTVTGLGTLNQFNNASNPETFTITDTGVGVTLSPNPLIISDKGGNSVRIYFNETTSFTTPATIEVYSNKDPDFFFGSYSGIVTIKDGTPANDTNLTINFENNPCKLNDNLNLDISIEDINVEKGFGDGDDNEWFPLDEIEVEIDVENEDIEDINNIVVKWGLYNLETGKWIIDDEENDFNLKDDETETLFINFKLDDVNDFENNGEYRFFVWATGEGEESEVETCTSKDRDIEIIIENDFVVLDNIEYPETAQCGANVQITADVWNIGEDDQDDVFVLIENSELGISEQVNIGDIDKFDNSGTPLSFSFKVPSDAEEKSYSISLTVYDEHDDIYETDNDDKSRFIAHLRVEGNCAVSEPVSVSANLESGGRAGEELVVLVTVTNIGTQSADYRINIVEYSDWASSVTTNPETFTLDAGSSEEIVLKFDVLPDVSGEKSFDIEIFSGDKHIKTTQLNPFPIKASGISSLTGGLISEGNWYVWGIGLFNVVLILVIIFVAVRAARKRE